MVLESLESLPSITGHRKSWIRHDSAPVGAKLRVTSSVGKTEVGREAAASGAEGGD